MPLKKQPLQPRSLPTNWVRTPPNAVKEPSDSSPYLGGDMICALEKAADAAKEAFLPNWVRI